MWECRTFCCIFLEAPFFFKDPGYVCSFMSCYFNVHFKKGLHYCFRNIMNQSKKRHLELEFLQCRWTLASAAAMSSLSSSTYLLDRENNPSCFLPRYTLFTQIYSNRHCTPFSNRPQIDAALDKEPDIVHIWYNIIVRRTWQAKASGRSILFRHHCAWALCLPDGVDSILGEVLTATPEPKNDHNRHAVCVKDGEIAIHVPHIKCSLLYSSHFQSFTPCLHTWSCRDDYYECC